MLYLIRRLVMKLNRPTALPAEAPVAVPGQGEPAARTRGDRLAGPERPAGFGGMQSFPALSVRGLGKRFGDRAAFENVSFEIGYGEVFGFLGPNGAGKTHNRADARHPHRPDLRLGHGRRNPAHTGERGAINAHSVVATDIRRARSSAPDSALGAISSGFRAPWEHRRPFAR